MPNLLLRIAKDRDDQAFRELFETYSARIRSFMLRTGADAGVAEELTQETLLTVWRKAAQYSPEKGAASTWIFTIARNLRIDKVRKEAPWQELPDEVAAVIPAEDQPADEALASAQLQVHVRAALDQLTPEQRDVVTLAYIEGLSHGEIAARLGLPLGTVKSRMRLAYQKVRTALEQVT
jgi:RNA polymerase sigma-70 factor (ECF subfamily)